MLHYDRCRDSHCYALSPYYLCCANIPRVHLICTFVCAIRDMMIKNHCTGVLKVGVFTHTRLVLRSLFLSTHWTSGHTVCPAVDLPLPCSRFSLIHAHMTFMALHVQLTGGFCRKTGSQSPQSEASSRGSRSWWQCCDSELRPGVGSDD